MSENDRSEGSGEGASANKASTKVKRKRKTLVRKTRYLALEQRIVFDGAIAAEVIDKATQTDAPAKPAAEAKTPKKAVKPAEAPPAPKKKPVKKAVAAPEPEKEAEGGDF